MKPLYKQSLLLLTAALLMLPLLAPVAQAFPGCPYQFPSCTSACGCHVPCTTKCCNGMEVKRCLEVLCEGQCGFSLAAAPAMTPLLPVDGGSCTAPSDSLELTLEDALQAPVQPAEAVAETPQAS